VPHFKKKIFAEWPLKNGKRVRVHVDYFKGHDLIHVRLPRDNQDERPATIKMRRAPGVG
jgi:hypothetical protein